MKMDRMGRSMVCPKCNGNLVKVEVEHIIPWSVEPKIESGKTIQGKKVDIYECERCRYLEFYGMFWGFR